MIALLEAEIYGIEQALRVMSLEEDYLAGESLYSIRRISTSDEEKPVFKY